MTQGRLRYGDAHPFAGRIAALAPGSVVAASGFEVGDVVVEIDREPLHDILDWQWLTADDRFTITAERRDQRLEAEVERVPGQGLGVEFEGVVFDGVRQCVNSCAFCFISQLPAGLRPALYVRDDDFRLSFLYGNFITLTNLDDADVERIVRQHLSPLYVSLHAVDKDVRARLVRPTAGDSTLQRIDELLAAGIQLHVQIVLVPGVNDRDVLEGTLEWLAPREGILSVGVVPLGYTAHQRRYERSFTPEESRTVLERVSPWQERMRAERGAGWVYAADEFYLAAGQELPSSEAYDEFPQYENGIGLVRTFIDEFHSTALAPGACVPETTVLTGTLFAPVLVGLLEDAGVSERVRVLSVENRFFGGNVSVTGLLTASDLVAAIRNDGSGARYLVPDIVVNSDGLLLDDVPAGELARRAGARVHVIGSSAQALVGALRASG
ncbi:MAG: DUF512 domain-containing protein [Actinomycetia bacterium]|nr:DUF512 domain-containing protein [Actinomycetes bacterium]